jgi:hypothetical protein
MRTTDRLAMLREAMSSKVSIRDSMRIRLVPNVLVPVECNLVPGTRVCINVNRVNDQVVSHPLYASFSPRTGCKG